LVFGKALFGGNDMYIANNSSSVILKSAQQGAGFPLELTARGVGNRRKRFSIPLTERKMR
jgi:hypothetical protein